MSWEQNFINAGQYMGGLINNIEDSISEYPDVWATGASMLPVVGDAAGFAYDANEFRKDPSWLGGAGAAAGLLPFIPSGLGTVIGRRGATQEELLDLIRFEQQGDTSTGWWRGADGLPRKEIGDIDVSVDSAAIPPHHLLNDTTLAEALQQPEIYRRYPELGEMYTELSNLEGLRPHGQYMPEVPAIAFNASNPSAMLKGLLHERQHAIQQIEGFIPGANEDHIAAYIDNPGLLGPVNREINDLRNIGIEGSDKEIIAEYKNEIAHMLYLRDAGEAEARNVSRRANMPEEHFKNIKFEETFDIPYSEQLNIKGLLGY